MIRPIANLWTTCHLTTPTTVIGDNGYASTARRQPRMAPDRTIPRIDDLTRTKERTLIKAYALWRKRDGTRF